MIHIFDFLDNQLVTIGIELLNHVYAKVVTLELCYRYQMKAYEKYYKVYDSLFNFYQPVGENSKMRDIQRFSLNFAANKDLPAVAISVSLF